MAESEREGVVKGGKGGVVKERKGGGGKGEKRVVKERKVAYRRKRLKRIIKFMW